MCLRQTNRTFDSVLLLFFCERPCHIFLNPHHLDSAGPLLRANLIAPLTGRGQGGGDLTAAVLRRLYDEDPEVVLAVTGSDNLLHRVLLRHPYPDNDHTPAVDEEKENDVVVGGGSVSSRAAAVSSAAAIAATPWLSALSQARPAHPVAESGRVLGGLLRVAKASVAAIQAGTENRLPEELEEMEKTREAATRLLLECLPGPHANARVRLLRRACADVRVGGGGTSEADDAADAAAGRACKKAVRNVARAAVEMVAGLEESSDGRCCLRVFEGVGKALRGVGVPKSSKKKGSSKRKEADGMEVDGVKSKGLKEMGEEVCDALAAGFSAGDKTRQLQVRMWRIDGRGNRRVRFVGVAAGHSEACSRLSTTSGGVQTQIGLSRVNQ